MKIHNIKTCKVLIGSFFLIHVLNGDSYGNGQKISNNKIDEFIDNLLISEKFGKLAEKVAQKAVETILKQPNLRVLADSVKQNDSLQEKFNSHEIDVHLDTSIKNLSLKYKDFAKVSIYTNNSKNKEIQYTKLDDFTAKIDDELKHSNVEYSQHDNGESKTSIEENKSKIIEKTFGKSDEENEIIRGADQVDSLSVENLKTQLHFLSDKNLEDDDYDSKLDNKSDELSNKHLKLKEENKNRKKRIHKEGNKIYTFASSSDYEQYHEELERVEKKRIIFI